MADVFLRWNVSARGRVDGTRVFRRLRGDAKFDTIAEIESAARQFRDQDVPGGTFEYQVSIFNKFGSVESNIVVVEVEGEPIVTVTLEAEVRA